MGVTSRLGLISGAQPIFMKQCDPTVWKKYVQLLMDAQSRHTQIVQTTQKMFFRKKNLETKLYNFFIFKDFNF
jgi:hypothetical protein